MTALPGVLMVLPGSGGRLQARLNLKRQAGRQAGRRRRVSVRDSLLLNSEVVGGALATRWAIQQTIKCPILYGAVTEVS